MFKRFKVTGINENPKKPKRNLMKYLALGCVMALPAFALLKTGVLSMNKNVLVADQNKYDIVANLDGGKFELGTKPEFTKMDNGNWLYKYKPTSSPTKLPVPVKNGCVFIGWTVSAKPDIQKEYSIPAWHKGNLNVKANWKILEANLTTGVDFNTKVKAIPEFINTTNVVFDVNSNTDRGIDVSRDSNGLVKAYVEGNTLHIVSLADKIFINPDATDMFRDMTNLNSIDFSNLNTSKLTNLDSFLRGCSNLNTAIGLENFDTENVSNFRHLFEDTKFTELNLSNWKTNNTNNLEYMFFNCIDLTSVGDLNTWDVSKVTTTNRMFYNCVKLNNVNVTNWNTSKVTDMSRMFYNCEALAEINVSNWDTSSVVDMNGVFGSCKALKIIDVSNWDTSSVVDMKNTFANCNSLTTLDVSKWNTSKVTDLTRTFWACNSLPTINVSNWNTSNVTSMDRTFAKCYAVQELDVRGWNTSKVTDLTRTFWDCRTIQRLDCSKWDTSKVTNMDRTFCDVNNATEINVTGWNTSACTDFHRMFADCHNLLRLNVSSFDVSKGTDLAYMFTGCGMLESLDLTNFHTTSNKRFTGMFLDCIELKTLKIPNFDFTNATGAQSMFVDCHNLTGEMIVNALIPETMPEGTDPNDSEYWGIDYMFKNCSNLSGRFIVKYTTPEVKELARKMVATKTNGAHVYLHEEPTTLVNGTEFNKRIKGLSRFGDVTKIEFITKEIVPDGVDVSENNDGSIKAYVEGTTLYVASFAPVYANPDSSNMFNFKLIHSSHWEIGSTIGVPGGAGGGIVGRSLFARAKAFFMNLFAIRPEEPGSGYYTGIKVISLDNFDTSNVTNMENMFRGCGGLVQIPVNELKTDKVTNMSGAFSYCATITDLDLSKLKTPVLQNIDSIFKGCTKLTNLNIDGLNTSKVTSLESVFEDCARLNQIDISSWDISNVNNTTRLFAGCTKLSSNLTVTDEKITTYDYMFSDCSTDKNAKFIVKYRDNKTKELGRKMVETKNEKDHVYLDGDPLINGSMLISGREFNEVCTDFFGEAADSSIDYEYVKFDNLAPEKLPTKYFDASVNKDKSIIMYLDNNVLHVSSKDKIIANEDCSGMFIWDGPKPQNVDCSNLYVTNLTTTMDSMFSSTFRGNMFTNLFIKNKFDTSNVTSMYNMFANAYGVPDLTVFNTKNVLNMRNMFAYNMCNNINLSSFDFKDNVNLESMFAGCVMLSGEMTITNPNITSYASMFAGCSSSKNAKFIVKYKDTAIKELARKMVATKNSRDHVYLDGEEPPSVLLTGSSFNSTISAIPGFDNVTEIKFVRETPNSEGVNVSSDGSVKACITGNVLTIASENLITVDNDCSNMFDGFSRIKSIHFDNFNIKSATKISYMFRGCSELLSLNGFNFDGVIVTEGNRVDEYSRNVFAGCNKLAYVDLGNVVLGASCKEMFLDCSSLERVDMRKVNFSNVRYAQGMFENCINLVGVYGLESLDTTYLYCGGRMFYNCHKLSGRLVIVDSGSFRNGDYYGDDAPYMFTGCSTEPGTKFILESDICRKGVRSAMRSKSPNSNVYFQEIGARTLLPGYRFREMIKTIPNSENVTEIRFVIQEPPSSGVELSITDGIKGYVKNNVLYIASIQKIYANPNCSSMFERLKNIETIIFENFDTSNVTDMSSMFRDSVSLTNLDLSSFKTDKVSGVIYMFGGCRSLASLNLKGFNTSNIVNMTKMFYGCSELTNLDLSSFDMQRVDQVGGMFSECSKLTSEITIKNNSAMLYDEGDRGMFQGCSSDQNAKFIVKYTSPEAKELARKMVATKNPGDHVYLDGEFDDAILLAGIDFNAKVKTLANYNNVTRVEFNRVTTNSAKPGSVDVSSTRAPIYAYVEGNTLKVESNKQIYANKDAAEMFAGTADKSSPYVEIVFNNFDTSKVKWLYGMFANCKNLTSLDVSKFDTSNVTDMAIVFRNCGNLTTLDISKWDMSKAVRTRMMFNGCSELTTIVHGPLVTSANTDTYGMFAQCPKLTSINTAGWDVSNVTNMAHMFRECSNLSTIDVSNWDVSHVIDMEAMFYLDNNLNQLNVSNWRPASVTNMYYMFRGCSRLERLDTTNWVTTSVVDTSGMFWDCTNLKILDVTYWDTSNLKEAPSMFRGCAALTELNVGNWNTSSLTESGVMFNGCKFLKQLNVENWDVSNVSNMNSMFRSCENLVSLDLSKWDVSNVTNIADMFCDDYNLVSLNVSGWNTSNVTDMSQIFMSCYKLQAIDSSSWNTSKVTSFLDLFYDCNELTSVKFGNGWDTSNVTNMQGMFYRCLKLTSLDLSTFNTSKVTTFEGMFAQDKELISINNNNFDLSSATNTTRMFANNRKLNGSIRINNPSISLYTNMFYDCSCLNSSRFNVYYTPEAQSMAQTLVNTKTSNDNVVLAGIRSVADESADQEPTELSPQQDSANQNSVESTSNTVTITLNNGSMAMYPVQKIQIPAGKIGDLAKPDLNPKYAGQFGGYFYDENCTIPVKPNDVVTQDIELYAKW